MGAEEALVEEVALGPGYVVWESNRGGPWRIWMRGLDGGASRRLSPEEPGRDHCCPHISPDGRRIAYLSGEAGGEEYPPGGLVGALHLIARDGTDNRVVAAVARSYFENRAVVWRSADELIHIDGERATVALDLTTGQSRRLADPPAEHAWLIDPTLAWATTGRPTFAPYDPGRRAVLPRRRLGGCQPYFSGDGRWGFWTAGAGGPIHRVELGTGRVERILDKNDRRVPGGFGYAYFPMFSADGGLFAWAASTGGHDHFRTDYEVFVAESDPETLELVGPVLRVTRHAGTDRFPDAWWPPLALGRHSGEASLTTRLSAPSAGEWQWDLGDEATDTGRTVEHSWTVPGRYEVVARKGGETLRGLVVVRPPRPPTVLTATAHGGGFEVAVTFDEEIDAGAAELGFASGIAIAGREVAAGGSSLLVRLTEPLRVADRLTISGVRDRAQSPNTMTPATLVVEPPAWPASRRGLVFLWETADAANLVADRELGAERAHTLTAGGEATLDAHFAMVVDGGTFALERGETARLVEALKATNQLSLELTLVAGERDGRIVTWAGEKALNLWLGQRAGRLSAGLRTGSRGPAAYPEVELFERPGTVPGHLVLTYEPGRLTAYLNGERKLVSQDPQGDFYHWRELPLTFGGDGWRGRIEGVAIYDRVLDGAEVAEGHRLYREKREARPAIPRTVVEARIVRRSATPTLEEISPYREALFTIDYAVKRRVEGPPIGAELRAVQWAILDAEPLAVSRSADGARYRLTVESFASQPQLESVYLADALGGEPRELFYVVRATPVH
jgi:hypothetical protein